MGEKLTEKRKLMRLGDTQYIYTVAHFVSPLWKLITHSVFKNVGLLYLKLFMKIPEKVVDYTTR